MNYRLKSFIPMMSNVRVEVRQKNPTEQSSNLKCDLAAQNHSQEQYSERSRMKGKKSMKNVTFKSPQVSLGDVILVKLL